VIIGIIAARPAAFLSASIRRLTREMVVGPKHEAGEPGFIARRPPRSSSAMPGTPSRAVFDQQITQTDPVSALISPRPISYGVEILPRWRFSEPNAVGPRLAWHGDCSDFHHVRSPASAVYADQDLRLLAKNPFWAIGLCDFGTIAGHALASGAPEILESG